MATLTDPQVINIIKTNPNGKFIEWLKAKYTLMRAHVTGIGADKLINRIQGFERENIMQVRKKMMLSNKDVLKRVLKPRAKIFTAKGGIESYNLTTNEMITQWKLFLSRCAGKKTSLKEYIQQEIITAFDIDPMGLKWVGINDEGNPYPCYKCIMDIYDYEINNDGTPEYVVFKVSQKEIDNFIAKGLITGVAAGENDLKVYRVVCDGYDRIVLWANREPEIIAQIKNIFGEVQGEVISDILCADEDRKRYWESSLYIASELLSQMVFGRSIYNIAYSQVAYPIMWMQSLPCPTCGGKGVLGQPMGADIPHPGSNQMKCPECGGSGVYPHVQNSDTYIFEFNNDPTGAVPRPPIGIIETAIDNLQYMRDEGRDIESLINETIWGVVKVDPNAHSNYGKSDTSPQGRGNTSETAFEAALNDEPKKDTLKGYSKWLGNSIKWYADTMGRVKYGMGYISSAIICGDRYATESPDEILTRITKAKAAGAAQAVLQSLHFEYLETKYENNPLELRREKIYYIGEPYFFFSVADILLWPQIPQIQLLEKQMWGEFMCTLTDNDISAIPDDNIIPVIQKMVRDYVTKKFVTDKQVDSLLFAGDGQLLNIGDNARVKINLAKDPSDLGKSYKVTNIEGENVTLQDFDGGSVQYLKAELERTF